MTSPGTMVPPERTPPTSGLRAGGQARSPVRAHTPFSSRFVPRDPAAWPLAASGQWSWCEPSGAFPRELAPACTGLSVPPPVTGIRVLLSDGLQAPRPQGTDLVGAAGCPRHIPARWSLRRGRWDVAARPGREVPASVRLGSDTWDVGRRATPTVPGLAS